MSDILDPVKDVRDGEQVDADKLYAYLQSALQLTAPLTIRQFPSGHSNLTYLLSSGDRDWVMRRPPFGSKVKSAHDMGREFRILDKLHAAYPPAPKPEIYCDDDSVIGAPFYVMQRIAGVILRRSPPKALTIDSAMAKGLSEAFVDNLVQLHQLDFRAIGLGELGKPDGYVERQVTGWTKRYAGSKTDDIPEVDQIAKWLAERIPKSSAASLIHNDYKYDNLVLDSDDITRIIGVLDWEMSTLGDPLMDLGTALGYWVEPTDPDEVKSFAFGPTALPGSFTRMQLAERYAEKTGTNIDELLFYYCFALFKTAVVAQQIYYRFKQGLTKDERFGAFILGVRILSNSAVRAAEAGRV